MFVSRHGDHYHNITYGRCQSTYFNPKCFSDLLSGHVMFAAIFVTTAVLLCLLMVLCE